MSSPWGTIIIPETKNLQEIISEELKENLQTRSSKCATVCPSIKWKYEVTDEELAKILQEEYNVISSEDDDVCGSWDCDMYNNDSDLEEVEDLSEKTYYEKFSPILEKFDPVPLYNCKNRQDLESSSTCKNIIFDVDAKMKFILNAMIEKKIFDKMDFCVSQKTAAVVFQVKKFSNISNVLTAQNLIVKSFKLVLPDSKKLGHNFIKKDYLSLRRPVKKPITRKLIYDKAQKEAIYLQRLKKAGIPCPKVVALKGNVIVLSLIGETKPASNLKVSHLDDLRYLIAYEQVMGYMKTMYQECNLIHTNLSEENILWYKDCCYIISLSKAVEPHEGDALKLLFDDCTNVCMFFTKAGVPKVVSPDELFIDITGYSYLNRIAFNELQDSVRKKKHS